jgi:uncharacterized membrane protein
VFSVFGHLQKIILFFHMKEGTILIAFIPLLILLALYIAHLQGIMKMY